MSRTVSPASGKPYGLALVCRVWRLARSGVYRHRAPAALGPRRRPGPVGPLPDGALVEAIRRVLAASPFHGEGHRKVWARLRHGGIRTSWRRVLRLMGEHDLLAPSWVGSPRGPRNHDGTIIPERVDMMWGTDLTTTITGEGQVAVFVAVDHWSAECVGIHAARQANRFEALEPIRQGVRHSFGAFGKGVAQGLAVRHDHGSHVWTARGVRWTPDRGQSDKLSPTGRGTMWHERAAEALLGGFQGEGGFGGDPGRADGGAAGEQAWRAPDADQRLEEAGSGRHGGRVLGPGGGG